MAKRFSELRDKMSPERRARNKARAMKIIARRKKVDPPCPEREARLVVEED